MYYYWNSRMGEYLRLGYRNREWIVEEIRNGTISIIESFRLNDTAVIESLRIRYGGHVTPEGLDRIRTESTPTKKKHGIKFCSINEDEL